MKIYFHGTNKSKLNSILKKGFSTEYGRATFTTNPLYTASFSSAKTWGTAKRLDIQPVVKEGMLLVFKDTENKMKIAKESFIIFRKKEKIITGWPNRFKTEQFGYFKRKSIPIQSLIGAYSYSKDFIKKLEQINKKIISGEINEEYIKNSIKELEKIMEKLQIINSKVPLKTISTAMVYGMIRNQVLREIRTCYLSNFALNGWKIVNYGTHPVKLKDDKEVKKSIQSIKRLMNKRFISKDIKKEYLKIKPVLSD